MIEITQMCDKCRQALSELSAKDGGLIFCSHRSNSPTSGVFVAAVPVQEGGCKLQIVYPCTESAAREKAREILRDRRQGASR
ncbi:MAG: hypothetical protein U5R46_01890 [Gammaproteobacteria bacterium]|nr:hypothetical protein [Gammaproteobacteria bacterium]